MNFSSTQYAVTKQFTAGALVGLTFTVASTVAYQVGREYKEPLTSGRFIVTRCVPVETEGN